MPIHATAVVDKRAEIAPEARIDAYAVIDGPVRIAAGTHIYPHAYVSGWTELGPDCQVHPGAVVGHEPQDYGYDGSETYCRIAGGTIIREGASVHRGTQPGSATIVGQGCLLMGASHIAHNCELGEEVILANAALLAGHVSVGRKAFISGGAVVHQFARIGELTMIAGNSRVSRDVPPFMMTDGKGHVVGLNVVGLRRAGFDADSRAELKSLYRRLYRGDVHFTQIAADMVSEAHTPAGRRLAEFVATPSKRGCTQGSTRRRQSASSDD